ncbi:conserved hypothetical protein [Nocardioides sp. AX2bis]|nr:conserved hypothetical protein [Nocardioides sp. AX2bis]
MHGRARGAARRPRHGHPPRRPHHRRRRRPGRARPGHGPSLRPRPGPLRRPRAGRARRCAALDGAPAPAAGHRGDQPRGDPRRLAHLHPDQGPDRGRRDRRLRAGPGARRAARPGRRDHGLGQERVPAVPGRGPGRTHRPHPADLHPDRLQGRRGLRGVRAPAPHDRHRQQPRRPAGRPCDPGPRGRDALPPGDVRGCGRGRRQPRRLPGHQPRRADAPAAARGRRVRDAGQGVPRRPVVAGQRRRGWSYPRRPHDPGHPAPCRRGQRGHPGQHQPPGRPARAEQGGLQQRDRRADRLGDRPHPDGSRVRQARPGRHHPRPDRAGHRPRPGPVLHGRRGAPARLRRDPDAREGRGRRQGRADRPRPAHRRDRRGQRRARVRPAAPGVARGAGGARRARRPVRAGADRARPARTRAAAGGRVAGGRSGAVRGRRRARPAVPGARRLGPRQRQRADDGHPRQRHQHRAGRHRAHLLRVVLARRRRRARDGPRQPRPRPAPRPAPRGRVRRVRCRGPRGAGAAAEVRPRRAGPAPRVVRALPPPARPDRRPRHAEGRVRRLRGHPDARGSLPGLDRRPRPRHALRGQHLAGQGRAAGDRRGDHAEVAVPPRRPVRLLHRRGAPEARAAADPGPVRARRDQAPDPRGHPGRRAAGRGRGGPGELDGHAAQGDGHRPAPRGGLGGRPRRGCPDRHRADAAAGRDRRGRPRRRRARGLAGRARDGRRPRPQREVDAAARDGREHPYGGHRGRDPGRGLGRLRAPLTAGRRRPRQGGGGRGRPRRAAGHRPGASRAAGAPRRRRRAVRGQGPGHRRAARGQGAGADRDRGGAFRRPPLDVQPLVQDRAQVALRGAADAERRLRRRPARHLLAAAQGARRAHRRARVRRDRRRDRPGADREPDPGARRRGGGGRRLRLTGRGR